MDEEENLVIDGWISCLKVADLRNIRYRAGVYCGAKRSHSVYEQMNYCQSM